MAIQGFGNANQKDIRAFEKNIGVRLPDDYFDFLLQYNGGIVELTDENTVRIEDLGESIYIDILFGLNSKRAELGLELWQNDYRSDMPSETIIIGTSYQHGFIILICSGEDAGVYYWDHAYEFSCSNDETNTYFMADTFTDFIRKFL